MSLEKIHFVTSSNFKREENAILASRGLLSDGTPIAEAFEFVLVRNSVLETLEPNLERMVIAEAKAAYGVLRKPCIVEHAGLVFDDYAEAGYPGGLTKPMWNTLRDQFLTETHSADRPATARAIIGYCDGKHVYTFSGESRGRLSSTPRGARGFYWDTIFVPDDKNSEAMTYAEIVESKGLEFKVLELSQSTKAMMEFLHWRLENSPDLWSLEY